MKKVNIILIAVLMLLYNINIFSQVAINTTGTNPDSSAMLDVSSTTKGLLIPRMTQAQIQTIANPADGLMVFDLDLNKPVFFNGTNWMGFNGQIYDCRVLALLLFYTVVRLIIH